MSKIILSGALENRCRVDGEKATLSVRRQLMQWLNHGPYVW
ncbi:hypothetical protein SJI19_10385 [Acerihabitans sp. TG2]|nr:hypothetical protein [Acerihabitans sp. TG2]MEA9390947.1 hypothetical protein [Acerihabitans sp. TG2]